MYTFCRSIRIAGRRSTDNRCICSLSHRLGEVPTTARNVRLKAAWSAKPLSRAISESGAEEDFSRNFARSTLRAMR